MRPYKSFFEENKTIKFFHRSPNLFKIGEILYPLAKDRFKDRPMDEYIYRQSEEMNKKIESFRKENFPEKLSQSDSVYMSLTPDSDFFWKGRCYQVEPIGEIFYHDSSILTKIHKYVKNKSNKGIDEIFDSNIIKKYLNEYWKGIDDLDSIEDLNSIEAVSRKAKVLGNCHKQSQLFFEKGQIFVCDTDTVATKTVSKNVFSNLKKDKNLEIEIINEIKFEGEELYLCFLYLHKGWKGEITDIHYSSPSKVSFLELSFESGGKFFNMNYDSDTARLMKRKKIKSIDLSKKLKFQSFGNIDSFLKTIKIIER